MTLPSSLNYRFTDPLGGLAPATTSNNFSAWDDDDYKQSYCSSDKTFVDEGSDDENDKDDDDDDGDHANDNDCGWHHRQQQQQQHVSTCHPSFPKESTSGSSWSTQIARTASRVRFSSEAPQICCYERASRDLFSKLFYSCHELQKMLDESVQEREQSKTAQIA